MYIISCSIPYLLHIWDMILNRDVYGKGTTLSPPYGVLLLNRCDTKEHVLGMIKLQIE